MAYGGDQELVAALRSRSGDVWGALGLYREPDRPLFDDEDLAFVRRVSPILADAVRRGLLVGEASDPEGPGGPVMIVLELDWQPQSTSPPVSIGGYRSCPTCVADRRPSADTAETSGLVAGGPGGSE